MARRHGRWQAAGAFCLSALLWIWTSAPIGAAGDTGAAADPEVAGQIILRLQSAADLPNIAAQYSLDPTPLDQLTVAPLYLMHIADGSSPEVKAIALASDSRVAYAEPNVVGSAPEDQ